MADDDSTSTDEGTEDEGPEGEGQESQDDAGTDEGGSPEEVAAERDKLRTSLTKIKAERAKLRQELAAARAPKEEDQAEQPDDRLVRMAGISALAAEGLTKAQAKVAVRLLDLSGVEVDDDGDADFEDAIADLKEHFPGMFAKPGGQRTAGGRVSTADKGGTKPKPETTSQKLMRAAGYR